MGSPVGTSPGLKGRLNSNLQTDGVVTDVHTPSATVVEALMFSALLRLPRGVSREDKEAPRQALLLEFQKFPERGVYGQNP